MAPRRHISTGVSVATNSGPSIIDMHNLLTSLDTIDTCSMDTTSGSTHSSGSMNSPDHFARCCVPSSECLKSASIDFGLINTNDLRDCVRVICNNDGCTVGQYMHRECFDHWEQGVLNYLKSIGRARSWSDRQRQQNLWTKKGYDLVFKACGCKCGRGHLKKDLDWIPPMINNNNNNNNNHMNNNNNNNNNIFGRSDDEANKKKKKRNRNNQKPMLAIPTTPNSGYHPNAQLHNINNNNNNNHNTNGSMVINGNGNGGMIANNNFGPAIELRARAGSLSSSNGSSSPPVSGSSEHSISPIHNSTNGLAKKQKAKIEAYSERVRTTSGCNGIFSRRLDFSTFNMLPKTRLNSYQIKMEDEGNHGNDDTRLFILSSLAQHQKSCVSCILCEETMLVFDRYPLVDGTFFLSPKQHAKGCIEVKYENQTQYLTAVCMGCLEGVSPDRIIRCRHCAQKWDGSSLVLGTMYAYDIFAAMPCCTERLKCNNCIKLLLNPYQRLNFFSDYSHVVSCNHCNNQDTHFVKPLAYCYTKQPLQMYQQWP